MGFWETFKESYRVARDADTGSAREGGPDLFDWAKSDRPKIAELEATLSERDAQLAESKQLIADLAAHMEQLEEELKIARRTEGERGGDDKYQKLRRVVLKKIHPDRASADEKLAAALTKICKEINAEIDRIDRQ